MKEIFVHVICYRYIGIISTMLYQKKILIYCISFNHLCVGVLLQVIENTFLFWEGMCVVSGNFVRSIVCFLIGIL